MGFDGLMLNELVSNALKHAFPDGREGTIVVTLGKLDQLLSVSDDGVGLPAAMNTAASSSLGLELVHLLAEQIGAQVHVESDGGTRVTVAAAAK